MAVHVWSGGHSLGRPVRRFLLPSGEPAVAGGEGKDRQGPSGATEGGRVGWGWQWPPNVQTYRISSKNSAPLIVRHPLLNYGK